MDGWSDDDPSELAQLPNSKDQRAKDLRMLQDVRSRQPGDSPRQQGRGTESHQAAWRRNGRRPTLVLRWTMKGWIPSRYLSLYDSGYFDHLRQGMQQQERDRLRPDREADDVSPSLCGKRFVRGDRVYSCRDCGEDSRCVMCADCFENSEHRKHRYRISMSRWGGGCDCGDQDAFRADATCEKHLAVQPGDHPQGEVLPDLQTQLLTATVTSKPGGQSLVLAGALTRSVGRTLIAAAAAAV